MNISEMRGTKPLLILIALLQGLFLLGLHELIEFDLWPYQSPSWLYGLYAMAIVGPLMLLLSLERGQRWQDLVVWIAPFTLLCGLVAFYSGAQVHIYYSVWDDDILFPLIITLSIAGFKALMYTQQHLSKLPFQYSYLFLISWRNALTLALSLLFTLAVWGILMLWGGLFRAINIRVFQEFFLEPWFYYPALALANGFGIVIFSDLSHVIDTITRLLQALMKFLLVFLVLVSLLFLGALLFTGLTPLWETGFGSGLILWMQALLLFFLNAVYQDKPDVRPFPLVIHRFIYIGIATLPIYSAIVFYGLFLRLDQYGWTPQRCWAFLVWFFFALFSLGYCWGIVTRRDKWIEQLSWVNVRGGLVLLVTMIVVNSPLMDFRKITVHSQLARLENGAVTIEKFDANLFRFQLAEPGYQALQTVRTEYGESYPRILEKIDATLEATRPRTIDAFNKVSFLASIESIDNLPLPNGLADALFKYANNYRWRFSVEQKAYVLKVDLDENFVSDYLLINQFQSDIHVVLFSWENKQWVFREMGSRPLALDSDLTLYDALKAGRWKLNDNRWKIFELEGREFQVR